MSKAKKSGDHQVIRHAYENTLTACARLASFAGQPTNSLDSLVDLRQELLATDDLVAFSINARRLIHAAASSQKFINICINVETPGASSNMRITTVLDVIIHHKYLRIARSDLALKALEGASFDDVLGLLDKNQMVRPTVLVESDIRSRIKFTLLELIKIFEEHILVPIVEICAEDHHLILDDDM